MGAIENYNCEGMCQHETCQEKYTHIIWLKMNDFRFSQLFCKEHNDEFELMLIDKRIEVKENGS